MSQDKWYPDQHRVINGGNHVIVGGKTFYKRKKLGSREERRNKQFSRAGRNEQEALRLIREEQERIKKKRWYPLAVAYYTILFYTQQGRRKLKQLRGKRSSSSKVGVK